MVLLFIILFTLLASVLSVLAAGGLLLLGEKRLAGLSVWLIPYALGTLLATASLGMLPHALEHLPAGRVFAFFLGGFLLFYFLEKFALWRHCHEQHCQVHTSAGTMILIGDSLHNFVDGVAIAAAFSASFLLGLGTSLAIIAHEIPQEVGDFAILLQSGFSRQRALFYNILSSLTSLLGALLTYLVLPLAVELSAYLLSVAAAGFLYIALADLVPGRRAEGGGRSLLWEIPVIMLGILTIALVHLLGNH
jgi:zinc and cadmium transporter